jgi:hypothetical protein
MPTAHAFLGRRRQVCGVRIEEKPMQGKPEAKFTHGDARRQASEPHTRCDPWLALHGVP